MTKLLLTVAVLLWIMESNRTAIEGLAWSFFFKDVAIVVLFFSLVVKSFYGTRKLAAPSFLALQFLSWSWVAVIFICGLMAGDSAADVPNSEEYSRWIWGHRIPPLVRALEMVVVVAACMDIARWTERECIKCLHIISIGCVIHFVMGISFYFFLSEYLIIEERWPGRIGIGYPPLDSQVYCLGLAAALARMYLVSDKGGGRPVVPYTSFAISGILAFGVLLCMSWAGIASFLAVIASMVAAQMFSPAFRRLAAVTLVLLLMFGSLAFIAQAQSDGDFLASKIFGASVGHSSYVIREIQYGEAEEVFNLVSGDYVFFGTLGLTWCAVESQWLGHVFAFGWVSLLLLSLSFIWPWICAFKRGFVGPVSMGILASSLIMVVAGSSLIITYLLVIPFLSVFIISLLLQIGRIRNASSLEEGRVHQKTKQCGSTRVMFNNEGKS